ncbi:uncharacterized protein LOC108142625 [Drosophila elegans]|uniref:uncharacterized protein LOC108142625 n=1 Tax=Drosophila elegans TaxID=30023 RepID=UPI0007E735FB|nr:uncharacterized protein LOC108142625 [Drosophila elegans]
MKLLILLLFSSLVQGLNALNNSCISCSMIKNNHGQHTGHQCHHADQLAITDNSKMFQNEFPQCVPNEYEINGGITEYCCFWSPELGCSVLFAAKLGEDHLKACTRCRAYCFGPNNHDGEDKIHKNSGHVRSMDMAVVLLLLTLSIFLLNGMLQWNFIEM